MSLQDTLSSKQFKPSRLELNGMLLLGPQPRGALEKLLADGGCGDGGWRRRRLMADAYG
jgi:hypothetical protein